MKEVGPITHDETEEHLFDLDRLVEYFFDERRNEISCVVKDNAPQGEIVRYQI